MSNEKNTGGSAFPRKFTPPNHQGYPQPQEYSEGLTMRDYFAAKAMHGFLAHPGTKDVKDVPRAAYIMADAMLKAREQ